MYIPDRSPSSYIPPQQQDDAKKEYIKKILLLNPDLISEAIVIANVVKQIPNKVVEVHLMAINVTDPAKVHEVALLGLNIHFSPSKEIKIQRTMEYCMAVFESLEIRLAQITAARQLQLNNKNRDSLQIKLEDESYKSIMQQISELYQYIDSRRAKAKKTEETAEGMKEKATEGVEAKANQELNAPKAETQDKCSKNRRRKQRLKAEATQQT